jgi:hypothetical protein
MERDQTGIPLDDALQQDLITMRSELGLDIRLDFE